MTTLTADAHREQMMRRLEAGEGYSFLTMSIPYLEACRDDHYVRLMAIREYLKLGLVDPARELFQISSPGVSLPSELSALRQEIATMHGSTIPWSQLAQAFESNLAALAGRGMEVSAIRQAWAERHGQYELFRDRNGVDQVRVLDRQGRWRWIPCLCDHRAVADAQPLPDDIGGHLPGPYLFEGIGLGWYFGRVYEATRDTFLGYSCALFVVEADPAALAVVLHLHDWVGILSDPRVFLFLGDLCKDGLRRAWDADPDLPWPRKSFTFSTFRPARGPSALEVVRQAERERQEVLKASVKALEARYASRDLCYWAGRFEEALSGRGEPLRILAAVSIHTTFLQYSMRDACQAFEDLGHRCLVLTEKTNYQITGPLTYHQRIKDFDPDLFFILDHLRPEFGDIIPKNLPVLTWDQDCLPQVFTKSNLDSLAGHDFIAGCSKSRFVLSGYNPKQYLNATVPTSPERFSGEPLTDQEQMAYACDISYVSHASQTPGAFHKQERGRYQDSKMVELLDAMYEMMPVKLSRYCVPGAVLCAELLQEASGRCGIEIRDRELRNHLSEWYMWRLGDRMFRHEALEWVAKWARGTGRSFRIYGNGWDQHPTLSQFAAGPAKNGRELLCIHRATKINLQLMPAGFIHQRAMDGLASGGFFLARATPGDTNGKTLRRLEARIRALGITTPRQLIENRDETLRTLLTSYVGGDVTLPGLRWVGPHQQDLLVHIQTCAELQHPDEVFDRLPEILFDSESQFVTLIERFITDHAARSELAAEMREVVVERFSYRRAMDRFLRAMGAYLLDALRQGQE